jgi:peptide/nickel transport system substrate-binding protein
MRKRLFGLLATTAVVFAACQGATSPSPSGAASPSAGAASPSAAPSASPEPTPIDYEALLFSYEYEPEAGTPGGNVIISDWQAANQLHPAYSNAFANTQVFAATMRTLFIVTSDGHWKPDLAEKMPKFSDDTIRPDDTGTGFEVDVQLKEGLAWSDGEPVTMNDFKFTWEWILDPDQVGISTLGWDIIDEITVNDDLNATVHFKEAFAGFYGTIGGFFFPQHYFETVPVAQANTQLYPLSPDIASAVTIGPFKYVTASADTIELERDENWTIGEACEGGNACLDRVTYKFYPDNKEGMIAAFLAGEIDVALDLVQADYDAIKGVDPAVGKAILEPAWLYEHFDMNQSGEGAGKGHPALQELAVRQAIAQAIDKEAMWNVVFPGQPYPDVPLCVNATPTNYWQLPNAECLTYDVDAANALLEEEGITDSNGDGSREFEGEEIVLEHCTSTAGFRQTGGEFLKAALADIGITLNLNFVDSTSILFANWPDVAADTKCNLAHGQYDTSEFAYVLTFDLFGDYYYSYHTEQIPTDENDGNGFNYLRLTNSDMDSALDTLKAAIRPEDQLEAVYTVQEVYIDQVPEVVLYYRAEARGVAADLHNFQKNPGTSSDMWNIEDWWVDG